jgi:glutamate 5-kinase
MKRFVIKIGSRVLAKKNGFLNDKVVSNLVRDIVKLKKEKRTEIILVTSGAVSVGKAAVEIEKMKIDAETVDCDKNVVREQVFAAIGQPRLMALYIKEFDKYGINCAQILATRSDFASRKAYLSLRTVTENLLKAGIVPIFNENDVLSPEELDFSDNDQLAAMIAAMTISDKLIILSTVDGLYDGSIDDPKSKIIDVIENITDSTKHVDDSNVAGKGGMKSKLMTADLVTSLGIDMHIGNGAKRRIIEKISQDEIIGTYFPAKQKKSKALRNWLAAGASGKGKIIVSTCLAEILRSKKTASILFIGIEQIVGNFSEKDIVEIADDEGSILGRGVTRYGSSDLRKEVGRFRGMTDSQRSKLKASSIIAVHYDYFVYC